MKSFNIKPFKYLFGLILVLLVSQTSALEAPGLNNVSLFAIPSETGLKNIAEFIDQAESSIDMTIYHLTNRDIIAALINAQNRGVNVTVLLDNQSTEQPKYQEVFDKLKSAGVNAIKSTKKFTLTHSKAFVFDKKTAVIMTMNLSSRANIMRGFGISTQDPKVVNEILSVFETDLKNAQENTSFTPPLKNPNLIWSPVTSLPKLLGLIDSAQKSIRLYVENLGHAEVIAALIRASGRGVDVRVLVPLCDFHPNPFWNIKFLNVLTMGGGKCPSNASSTEFGSTVYSYKINFSR